MSDDVKKGAGAVAGVGLIAALKMCSHSGGEASAVARVLSHERPPPGLTRVFEGAAHEAPHVPLGAASEVHVGPPSLGVASEIHTRPPLLGEVPLAPTAASTETVENGSKAAGQAAKESKEAGPVRQLLEDKAPDLAQSAVENLVDDDGDEGTSTVAAPATPKARDAGLRPLRR